MVASPNFIYGVYDADESTFAAPVFVPPGSAALEDLFEAYYTIEGIPYEDTEFSGRSDYQAFIDVGIPASGLFTGAEGIKTAEQEAIWGGTAGDQYDPCYHLACDTYRQRRAWKPLDVNVDAIAYAIYILAATTEAVNGVPGRRRQGHHPRRGRSSTVHRARSSAAAASRPATPSPSNGLTFLKSPCSVASTATEHGDFVVVVGGCGGVGR